MKKKWHNYKMFWTKQIKHLWTLKHQSIKFKNNLLKDQKININYRIWKLKFVFKMWKKWFNNLWYDIRWAQFKLRIKLNKKLNFNVRKVKKNFGR